MGHSHVVSTSPPGDADAGVGGTGDAAGMQNKGPFVPLSEIRKTLNELGFRRTVSIVRNSVRMKD